MQQHKIIVFVLLLVFVSGCSQFKKEEFDLEDFDFKQGYKGLEVRFLENLPPKEIIANSGFVLGLELKNEGAYDIENGMIRVMGYIEKYFTFDQETVEFDISGRNIDYPEGGYEFFTIQGFNDGIPKSTVEYEEVISVLISYPYKTELDEEVCINPRPYAYIDTGEEVCQIRNILLDGQGAPVVVKKIEEFVSPDITGNSKIEFKLHVANRGDGDVDGNVKILSARVSDKALKCEPNEFNLEGNKEKTIQCYAMFENKGVYTAPLIIDMGYDYVQRLDKTIKVIDRIKSEKLK